MPFRLRHLMLQESHYGVDEHFDVFGEGDVVAKVSPPHATKLWILKPESMLSMPVTSLFTRATLRQTTSISVRADAPLEGEEVHTKARLRLATPFLNVHRLNSRRHRRGGREGRAPS